MRQADRAAFESAIEHLGVFQARWPEALGGVITGRHAMEDYRELLVGKPGGIKNVIRIGG